MTTSADIDLLRCAARLHVGKKVSDEEFDSVLRRETEGRLFSALDARRCRVPGGALAHRDGSHPHPRRGSGRGKVLHRGRADDGSGLLWRRAPRQPGRNRPGGRCPIRRRTSDFHARQHIGFRQRPLRWLLHLQPISRSTSSGTRSRSIIDVETSPDLHRMCVASTTAKLTRARPGTAVVTFNGLGGPMPPHYRRCAASAFSTRTSTLWIKKAKLHGR